MAPKNDTPRKKANRRAKLKAAILEAVEKHQKAKDDVGHIEAAGNVVMHTLWLVERHNLDWSDLRGVLFELRGPVRGLESWYAGDDRTARDLRGEV